MIKYFGIVFLLLGGVCTYYKLQNVNLEHSNEKLKSENSSLTLRMNSFNEKIASVQETNIELSETVNKYRIENQTLQAKLYKLETSMEKIAKKHPKMLENIINNAQKETNECFEKLSKSEEC